MSKKRNRAKLKKAQSNKEYKYINNILGTDLCFICLKRSGTTNGGCNYWNIKKKQRNWKKHRAKQYKE